MTDKTTTTEADLRALMRDPRYWRDRDPEVIARVTEGWSRLYGTAPAAPTTTPAGKWMPEEPTREMYAAFWDAEAGYGCTRFEDAYRALYRAAPASRPAAQGWMPIETAPMDGRTFLAYGTPLRDHSSVVRQTHWYSYHPASQAGHAAARGEGRSGYWWWEDPTFTRAEEWSPTHWMPLPPAPTAAPAQPAQDSLTETAKRIAWARHKARNPHHIVGDANTFWVTMNEVDRGAYLAAARASQPQPVGEVVEALHAARQYAERVQKAARDAWGPTPDEDALIATIDAALRSAGEGR